MSNDANYEYKTVQAVRGLETRAITKAQHEGGWELFDQTHGTLRTTLNFRRVKPDSSLTRWWAAFRSRSLKKQGALAGAAIIVVASAVVGIGVAAGQEKRDIDAAPAVEMEPSAPASALHDAATTSPAPASKEAEADLITVANNPEFAAILNVGDYCDASIKEFAGKYQGRLIKFDGSIAFMQKHGNYKTRFDILLAPGDEGTKSTLGPALKYEDVNMFDLKLAGDNIPEYVGENDKFQFVAEVGEYGPKSCLFLLNPVSTTIR